MNPGAPGKQGKPWPANADCDTDKLLSRGRHAAPEGDRDPW
jgi:hypothetical protein